MNLNVVGRALPFFIFLLLSQFGQSQTTYTLIAGGSITNPASWRDATNTAPVDFSGAHTWSLDATTNTALTLSSSWGIASNATVVVSGGTSSTLTLTYNSSASIGSAHLRMNNNSILVLNTPYNFVAANTTYTSNAKVVYAAGSNSVSTDQYVNLDITSNVSINASSVSVSGTLAIQTGTVLQIQNNGTLTITGDIGNNTGFQGDIGSDGTGNIILNSATTAETVFRFDLVNFTFSNIFINKTSVTSFFRTFTVANTFSASGTGNIAFSANRVITLNGDIVFGSNALLRGTSTTSLVIAGSGSISGSLKMNSTFGFALLGNLTLNRATTLSLGSNLYIVNSLVVTSGTLSTGGFLTLYADASRTGRLGNIAGTISGNVSVQTFVPGNSTGWALWGVPGVTGKTVSNWSSQIPMSCNGCPNGTTSVAGGFNSIVGWNEPAADYDNTVGFSTALTPGKGFYVYVGSGFSSTTAFSLTTTGSVVQGAGTIPITKNTNNYNLIANPYASPISFTTFRSLGTNSSKIANAIYGWNADLNGGAGGAVQFAGGVSTPSGISGMKDVIPAGQGFFVEALSAGNLDYNETMKSGSNTSSNPLLREMPMAIARVRLSGVYDADETVLRIERQATTYFDSEFDAHRIFSTPGYAGYPGPYTKYTSLSTFLNNEDYSINTLFVPTGTLSVPLRAKVSVSGNYTISAFDYDNFGSCLVLWDKLTDAYVDLKRSDYTFTISDTTQTPRFELIVCETENVSHPLGIDDNTGNLSSNTSIYSKDNHLVVNSNLSRYSDASVLVTNLLGQTLYAQNFQKGQDLHAEWPVSDNAQIVLVSVSSAEGKVIRKIYLQP